MKITIRCHLIPVRMAVIKKARRDKCWGRCGEKGILVASFFWNINWYSHYRNSMEVPQKFKNTTTVSSNPTAGYISKGNENRIWKK